MNTLEKINMDGIAVIDKLKSGCQLTPQEIQVMKIYNSLNSGLAGNAGKRTRKQHNKNW